MGPRTRRAPPEGVDVGYAQRSGGARAAGVNVDEAQKANDSDIAGRILAEFLRRAEARIRAALDKKDLVTARKLVNGGSHGLNPFRTAYLRGREVYSDDLRLVG